MNENNNDTTIPKYDFDISVTADAPTGDNNFTDTDIKDISKDIVNINKNLIDGSIDYFQGKYGDIKGATIFKVFTNVKLGIASGALAWDSGKTVGENIAYITGEMVEGSVATSIGVGVGTAAGLGAGGILFATIAVGFLADDVLKSVGIDLGNLSAEQYKEFVEIIEAESTRLQEFGETPSDSKTTAPEGTTPTTPEGSPTDHEESDPSPGNPDEDIESPPPTDSIDDDPTSHDIDVSNDDSTYNLKTGDDIIIGGTGADTIYGAGGADTVSYENSKGSVQVNLGTGTCNYGDASGDTLHDIENLKGSQYADILQGDDNHNILDGGAGDDILRGGDGADTLRGGDGIDVADYIYNTQAVNINMSDDYHSDGDKLYEIEGISGTAFDDTLVGDEFANIFYGNSGDDRISSRDGDDMVYGRAGDDYIKGGYGDDQLFGGGDNIILKIFNINLKPHSNKNFRIINAQ